MVEMLFWSWCRRPILDLALSGEALFCRRLESCRRNLVWGRLLYRVWCAGGTNLEASAEEFPKYLADTSIALYWASYQGWPGDLLCVSAGGGRGGPVRAGQCSVSAVVQCSAALCGPSFVESRRC
jgi:hypothetical protein